MDTSRTSPDVLSARLDRLESESAIRSVMAEYLRLCDRLDADTPMDELGELFAEDAVWAGRGVRYATAYGALEGRASIINMLDTYCGPKPHFELNAHFLTSESISVDGQLASGSWVMLQTSTYSNGASDLRAARLHVVFARTLGGWRIRRFETENLFSRPVDHWDDPTAIATPTPTAAQGE